MSSARNDWTNCLFLVPFSNTYSDSVLVLGIPSVFSVLKFLFVFLLSLFMRSLPSVLWHCWLGGRKGIRPVKNWVVRCWHGYLEWDADLHMAQLNPLPLTISCFSKIQIGLSFWYRLTWVVPEKGLLNGHVCVCVQQMLIFHCCLSRNCAYVLCGDAFPIEWLQVATYLLSAEALSHCRCGVAN